MTSEYVWLITGASRGIGLEMVKQLLQSPSNTIVAACRSPAKATELQQLAEKASGKLHIVALDVSDKESIKQAAQEVAGLLGGKGIDYLINNAGVSLGGHDTAFNLDIDILQKTFVTNTAGPAYVSQAFIGLVEKGEKKTIVNISSTVGSIGSDFGATGASYAISKAALNMLTYKQAKEKPEITVISMCPGWLQTGEYNNMGGKDASHPVSFGVAGVLKTIFSLKPEDSGKFFNLRGELVPW